MTTPCPGCLNGTAHTLECTFQHFLCYMGYGRLSDSEIQRLRTAYFHGSDAKFDINQPKGDSMPDETTLTNTPAVTSAATDPVVNPNPPAAAPISPASPHQAKDWLQSIVAYAHREGHDIEQWFYDVWNKIKTAGEKPENEV